MPREENKDARMEKRTNFAAAIFFLLLFISIIGGGVILKLTASVCLPVVVAVLLSFAFLPLIKRLNAKPLRLPWWIAIILVFALFFAAFIAIANLLTSSLYKILSTLPRYEERLGTIFQLVCERLNIPFDTEQSLMQNLWSHLSFRNTVSKYALGLGSTLYDFVRNLLLVMLFSAFLLGEMNSTRSKLATAFSRSTSGKVHRMLGNIVRQVTRYISIKFVISLITGVLVWLGLLIVRQDFALVWGFFAFVMNFIPTFGSIFSWALTTLFAVLQFYPAPAPIVFMAVWVAAVNIILGNIIEPRVAGQNLGISPFIILVSLSLWGWMWGFVGMIIAVPVMVIIKIVCENFTLLHPVAIFLGNKPQDAAHDSATRSAQNEGA